MIILCRATGPIIVTAISPGVGVWFPENRQGVGVLRFSEPVEAAGKAHIGETGFADGSADLRVLTWHLMGAQ